VRSLHEVVQQLIESSLDDVERALSAVVRFSHDPG